MKIKDILKLINDYKIYIFIIDAKDDITHGLYTKNDLIYNDKYENETIKSINIQYIDNKRVLYIYI